MTRSLLILLSAWSLYASAFAETIQRETPLMSEPSSKSEVLFRLKPGETVQVIGHQGSWHKVRYRTKDGFDFNAWISTETGSPPKPQQKREGEVLYATLGEAYINLGTSEGITSDSVIRIARRGKSFSECRFLSASDHHSICAIQGAQAGDTVMTSVTPPAGREAVHVIPPDLPDRERARRLNLLTQAPVPQIEFHGIYEETGTISPVPIQASGEHSFWKSYSRERVDLTMRDVQLGATGFTATTDLSTWIWTAESDNARFRPDTPFQFYVAEAGVSYRRSDRPYSLSAGRIRLVKVPGIVTLDGTQAGWRIGKAEFGVYGGLTPDLIKLKPTTDQWLAGAYLSQDLWTTREVLVRYEWRIGLQHIDGAGSRLATEALIASSFRRIVDLSADVLVGLAGAGNGASFDALRADLGVRPTESLRIQLGGRLLENPLADPIASLGTGSRHMELSTIYDLNSGLSLVLLGGYAQELSLSEHRAYAGPEVRFRNLLGRRATVAVGAQEEIGWMAGRMFYLQPSFDFSNGTGIITRASYSTNSTDVQSTNEWGAYAGFHTRLVAWLSTRVGVQIRGGDSPFGVTGSISLSGQI